MEVTKVLLLRSLVYLLHPLLFIYLFFLKSNQLPVRTIPYLNTYGVTYGRYYMYVSVMSNNVMYMYRCQRHFYLHYLHSLHVHR